MHTHTLEHRITTADTQTSAPLSAPRNWLPLAAIAVVVVFATLDRATGSSATAAVAASTASPTEIPGLITSFAERPSHNRRYSAEVVSHSPLAVGSGQSWTVHLAHRGTRLAHATVTARAWMPETGDSAATATSVRYVGRGNYRIDGLVFSQGWWNVALVIDAARGTDSVAFNVILPPAHRDGAVADVKRR